MSTRGVVFACLGFLVLLTAVLVINRPGRTNQVQTTSAPSSAQGAAPQSASGPAVVVRVDGAEVEHKEQPLPMTRMSDLAAGDLTASMISHLRSVGDTQILVLTDGSEVTVGNHNREVLPEDIQFRLSYDRGGR